MIRWGLCCIFSKEPIKFRTTTAAYLGRLTKRGEDRLQFLSQLVLDNVQALKQAINYCETHSIGAFRINSNFLPVSTHPEMGYTIDELYDCDEIVENLRAIGASTEIRLSFHPDQFVVLSTPKEDVLEKSLRDLECHGRLAELLQADVINIHGGGGYGNKTEALNRFIDHFSRLSPVVTSRLTVENDDKVYTPTDLIDLCDTLKIPLVYDVHHHRCLPDDLSVEAATEAALKTWNREPLFHISSPLDGWAGKKPHRHHDYIDPADFPRAWLDIPQLTVDVEAKAKELAIAKLIQDFSSGALS